MIVLLTDFGLQDSYAGIVKGVIASLAPRVPLIDLTHGIGPQNIGQASLVLAQSYRYFPRGSIFVCVVDPFVGTNRKIVAAKTRDYYFLAPDNGLLTEVAALEPKIEFRSLENKEFHLTKSPSHTFHGRDIFSPAAAHLAVTQRKEAVFHSFGPALSKIQKLPLPKPVRTKNSLHGEILFFDHFGNAITNIQSHHAPESFWKRGKVTAGKISLGPIARTYGYGKHLIAVWNSFGSLEIAVPGGSAKAFLKPDAKITISCHSRTS